MTSGGPAGQPAATNAGMVTGHSYTAAYRYQLVIGKVGGWAIPYPLTIPQAVTGLSAIVLAMITASWWYPLTGISGVLGVVVLPIIGIRIISRIRPEGRSVSDWLYGWGVAQGQGLTGRGVRLHVGLPTGRYAPVKPAVDNSAAAFPIVAKTVRAAQGMPMSGMRQSDSVPKPAAEGLTGLVTSVFPSSKSRPAAHQVVSKPKPSTRRTGFTTKVSPSNDRTSSPSRRSTTSKTGWSTFGRLFSKRTSAPEPERLPVFDPWGVTQAQGGMSS